MRPLPTITLHVPTEKIAIAIGIVRKHKAHLYLHQDMKSSTREIVVKVVDPRRINLAKELVYRHQICASWRTL